MDTEKSGEETIVAKEVSSKPETPEESPEPEKSPAAAEEAEQMAVNGHGAEVVNLTETEEAIVTETVTLTEEKADMEIEGSSPAEKSDMEPVPAAVAPPETDESSEKIPDPVAGTEPGSVPEKEPEPLAVRSPLAETAPEPEPEIVAESVPVAQLQDLTLEDPVTAPEPVDAEPPTQEEKEPRQEATKAEAPTSMETQTKEASEEKVEQKDVAAEPVAKAEAKSAESETLKEEPPAEAESVKPAEDKKEPEPEKEVASETVKVVVAAAAAAVAAAEGGDTEVQKEEDATPASGSLSFTILQQTHTKDALLTSRTLVVLRGLPGSGKSFLARAIADAYKDHCCIICADEHGVKPENPNASADGYKALDEAVVARCGAGTASSLLLVVDDTNHTQDRLARMGEIAEQHHLVAIFLEPRTEWSRDVAQLTKKSKRGLQEAQLQAMRGQLEEMCLPLYFGWFLLSPVQDKVRCTAMDFLKTLDTLEAFKKNLVDFTGKPDKEVDLEQYFKPKGILHCTTKFCNYGKADGCKEYAQKQAVQDSYGSASELSLTALFVTPRTVGARVSLSEEQLLLWPADAEKEMEAAASLPLGSRAHVTLGCAEGVEPVQTGFDLLDILVLQQGGQTGEPVEEMELGSLAYFGEGRWLLSLREPICAPALFSSFYGQKELEPAKKEPEKKKKPKCAIL